MSSLSLTFLSARDLAGKPTSSFEKDRIVDEIFAKEFGCRPQFFELEEIDSVRKIIETSPKELTQLQVMRAVRSVLHNEGKELDHVGLRELCRRVEHLPDDFTEKIEFMSFFQSHPCFAEVDD